MDSIQMGQFKVISKEKGKKKKKKTQKHNQTIHTVNLMLAYFQQ